MTKGSQSFVLFIMAGVIAAGLTLWRMGLMPGRQADAPLVFTPELVQESPAAPAEPAIKYPLEARPLARSLRADEIGPALAELLGREAVAKFLHIDEFPRRFVATVDNLARSHAPGLLWPVQPAPDRFRVDEHNGGPVIGLDNDSRYTPFVLLAESVDAARAVDLYVRLYPSLQRAYEELGFPDKYFNDRLVAVIDVLLATPNVEYPVKLQLTEVKGPIPSLRPWTRYEFADPALESLSAGQKILLRTGPVNQRRLKAKLSEIRSEIVKRVR